MTEAEKLQVNIAAGLFGPCVSEELPMSQFPSDRDLVAYGMSRSEFDRLVQEDMVDIQRQMRLALHRRATAEELAR